VLSRSGGAPSAGRPVGARRGRPAPITRVRDGARPRSRARPEHPGALL